MKLTSTLLKQNRISILIILAICVFLLLPVVMYQYPYPNHSDDFPRHLEVIQRVVNGQGYADLWESRNAYTGPAFTGLIIKMLHTDPYWTFYVLHYLALIAMVLSLWYFSYKVFNRTAANLALPFVVFCTPPFLQYFYNGVIFNMINLFIFGLMAILALIYFLRTWRPYYAAVSILLFGIAVLYHSGTGLYLLVGVGLYLVLSMGVNLKNRAWPQLKRLGIYAVVLTAFCGALTLTLAPEVRSLAGLAVSSVGGAYTTRPISIVSFADFMLLYANSIIVIALIAALIYSWRRKLRIPQGIGIILSIAFCLCMAAFVFKFNEPTRAAHDTAMLLSLAGAGAVGSVLQNVRIKRFRYSIGMLAIATVIAMALPMAQFWLQYQSSIRPADSEAIAALETLQGQTYSVSTQVSPYIYGIFLQGKTYTPTGGDYIVFRDNPMSGETDPDNPWCKVAGNVSTENDYDGLPVVGEFYDGNVRIVIYKGG